MIPRFIIPADWTRYWLVDFGYTNPFVWQCWATDPDGRAYRIAEIYQTHLLVEDAAALILAWQREQMEPMPSAIICDHDAEDRATLERHLGMETTPAVKQVLNGIHSVKSRLRVQGDGKPRMYFMYDSLIEPDPLLIDAMQPTCSEQEIEAYEWEDSAKKETPRKVGDHGMDTTRYLSVYLDNYVDGWSQGMGA
jgi:phage terminase large subunit